MKKHIMKIAFPVLLQLAASSCIKDSATPSLEGNKGMAVNIVFADGSYGTRSILEEENMSSGFQLFAYRRSSGQLELFQEMSAGDRIALSAGETYDLYVIGNLWFIDADGDRKSYGDYFDICSWDKALDPRKFPDYRFDGSLACEGLRYEQFRDITRFGIPYAGYALGVLATDGGAVNIDAERLFSKISVTVDHSGMVNGSVDENAFRNSKLYLRQANCLVNPFISGCKALSGGDILEESDCEPAMMNGSSLKFCFYVPENRQGVALSSEDPARIPENVPEHLRPLLTYLEFTAEVDGQDGSAGGYGGTVRYRCYLGAKTAEYFTADVRRNTNYNLTLSFRAGSLFNPGWKIECTDSGGLSDSRLLCFTKETTGADLLPDGQVMAVRKNREGRAWLYFNRFGRSGENEAGAFLDAFSSGYEPQNLSRSAYEVIYDQSLASSYGVNVSLSGGCLCVSCKDEVLFDKSLGKAIPVRVVLHPGGKEVAINAVLYDNVAVEAGLEEFYTGMKRKFSVKGYCSSDVRVAQLSGTEGLVGLGKEASLASIVDAGGRTMDRESGYIFAFGYGSSELSLSSADDFNDPVLTVPVTVLRPEPYYGDIRHDVPIINPSTGESFFPRACLFPMDGTPVELPASYRDRKGNTIAVGGSEHQFDPFLYSKLLAFRYNVDCEWLEREEGSELFHVKRLFDSHGALFGMYSGTFRMGSGYTLYNFFNAVEIRPVSKKLFSLDSDRCKVELCVVHPCVESPFPDLISDYFNYWDSDWNWRRISDASVEKIRKSWPSIENTAMINLFGCSLSNVSLKTGGSNSEYVKGSRVESVNGGAAVRWRFAPGETATDCFDQRGAVAPYGKQTVTVTISNMHSGEKLSFDMDSFKLTFNRVNLRAYSFFDPDESDAEMVVAAPLTIAWLLMERANNRYFALPSGNMPSPLDAYNSDVVAYTGVSGFAPGAENGTKPYFEQSDYKGNRMAVNAEYRAFWIDNNDYWKRPASLYRGICWDAASADASFRYGQLWAYGLRFQKGGEKYSNLPAAWYSDSRLSSFIKFGFEYDYQAEFGTETPIRLGYVMME